MESIKRGSLAVTETGLVVILVSESYQEETKDDLGSFRVFVVHDAVVLRPQGRFYASQIVKVQAAKLRPVHFNGHDLNASHIVGILENHGVTFPAFEADLSELEILRRQVASLTSQS